MLLLGRVHEIRICYWRESRWIDKNKNAVIVSGSRSNGKKNSKSRAAVRGIFAGCCSSRLNAALTVVNVVVVLKLLDDMVDDPRLMSKPGN